MAINVLVAVGFGPLRRILIKALSDAEDMSVAGEAYDGSRAVAMAASLNPDVILSDSRLAELEVLAGSGSADEPGVEAPIVLIVHPSQGEGGRIEDIMAGLPEEVMAHVRATVSSGATLEDLLRHIRMAAAERN